MLALLSTLNICHFSKILKNFFISFIFLKCPYFNLFLLWYNLFVLCSFQFNALLQMIFLSSSFYQSCIYLISEFFLFLIFVVFSFIVFLMSFVLNSRLQYLTNLSRILSL